MKKSSFLDLVYRKCRFANDEQIEDVYDGLMIAIQSAVTSGEEVTLQGIGKLRANPKPARIGRNPKTGASVEIPDRMSVKFTPSVNFRKAVKEMPFVVKTKDDESEKDEKRDAAGKP